MCSPNFVREREREREREKMEKKKKTTTTTYDKLNNLIILCKKQI